MLTSTKAKPTSKAKCIIEGKTVNNQEIILKVSNRSDKATLEDYQKITLPNLGMPVIKKG
jgi:hypothetical protein